MAGTVVVSYRGLKPERVIEIGWISSAGSVFNGKLTKEFRGYISRVDFIPNQAGSQPDNLYDITCEDVNGIDVFQGVGANLSNAANVTLSPGVKMTETSGNYISLVPPLHDGTLELKGANLGAAKTGTVVIFLAD